MDGNLLPLLTEFHVPVPLSLFLDALLSSKQFLVPHSSISYRQKGEESTAASRLLKRNWLDI